MPKIITGIDFDYHSVKIVQLKKTTKGLELIKLATGAVPQVEDAEAKNIKVAETISELLKGHKIKVVNLSTCIPRRFVTIRCLEIPSANETEIKEMLRFQAEKILPYSIEELVVRHQILSSTQSSSKVMVVVGHQDVMSRHLSILRKAGLESEKILLSSQAIFNSYSYHQTQEPFLAIAVVDIGFSVTDINFIHDGVLLFARSGSTSGATLLKGLQKELNIELEEVEELVTRIELSSTNCIFPSVWEKEIANEIRISLSAYKREIPEGRVNRCIITGGVANIKGLDKRLGDALGIPVEIGDPLKSIKIDSKIKTQYKIDGKMPQLSTVIGLTVGENKGVDLLPEEIARRQKQRQKRANLLLTGVLSSTLLLLISTLWGSQVISKYIYLNHLNQEIKKNAAQAMKIEAMGKRLWAIKSQFSSEGSVLDILYELYRLIPREVALCELIFEENKFIILRGESKEFSTIFSLITVLENSPYFENAQVSYATKRKVENKEVSDFQITCSLSKVS